MFLELKRVLCGAACHPTWPPHREILKILNYSYFTKSITTKPKIGNLTNTIYLYPFLESKKYCFLFKGILWSRELLVKTITSLVTCKDALHLKFVSCAYRCLLLFWKINSPQNCTQTVMFMNSAQGCQRVFLVCKKKKITSELNIKRILKKLNNKKKKNNNNNNSESEFRTLLRKKKIGKRIIIILNNYGCVSIYIQ